MRWVEIAVDATDASADAVTNIMIEEGCGGTAIDASSAFVLSGIARVLGYLPVDDRLEVRLERIRDRVRAVPGFGLPLASDEIGIKWVQDEDWADGWKQYFKPLRVGKVVVKPSWEEFTASDGDVIIEIDPGMAFGTGYHPTTQLCLLALQERMRGGEAVLDVGTGSGILAMAAALLGAKRVTGIDIDPVAVEAARRNVAEAGLAERVTIFEADSPAAFAGTADVVLANIIARVIVQMATDLATAVAPDGVLIASGIVQERRDETVGALEAARLTLVDEKHEGEWVALVMERR